jgi:hypothetical protein
LCFIVEYHKLDCVFNFETRIINKINYTLCRNLFVDFHSNLFFNFFERSFNEYILCGEKKCINYCRIDMLKGNHFSRINTIFLLHKKSIDISFQTWWSIAIKWSFSVAISQIEIDWQQLSNKSNTICLYCLKKNRESY